MIKTSAVNAAGVRFIVAPAHISDKSAVMETQISPGLYLVGTPIGNLEDMTYRAVRVLQQVDHILAEDTRKTGILLQHFGIRKPMHSCHGFNEASRVARVVADLEAGRAVALVSDAGMPLISDPGARLVCAVREAGLPLTAVPGPTALTTALALSGWGESGFVFAGFPPNKSGGRRRLLERFLEEPLPVIFYESTHRIEKLLADLAELNGERPVFFARELTKKFETLQQGTAEALLAFLGTHSKKGEFVVILGPKS